MTVAIGEPNLVGSRGQICARDALKPLVICLYYLRTLPSADTNLLRGNCAASVGAMCVGDFVPDHRRHINICQDDTVRKRPAHSVHRRRASALLWLRRKQVCHQGVSRELCGVALIEMFEEVLFSKSISSSGSR